MKAGASYLTAGLAALVATLGVISCSSSEPAESVSAARVDSLQDQLNWLSSSYSDLRSRLDSLKRKRRWAELDPAVGEGYVPIQSGRFLISLEDVEPHADGVQVTVEIGNTTSADFRGGVLKIEWGPRRPDLPEPDSTLNRIERLGEWFESIRSRTSRFSKRLAPGAWTQVTVNLPSTPPDEFGYFRIGLDTDEVRLRASQ